MRFLPVLVMIVAGFFISIQGPINARLRLSIESPVLSAAIGSYLIDAFGWFGVDRVPFNPVRLAGIGLLVLGVLLVQKK